MSANLFANRQNGSHRRALGRRTDLELPAELSNAFAHPRNAHTHHRICAVLGSNSAPAIAYFQYDVGIFRKYLHAGDLASRVPVNVRQAFLQNAKYREFHLVRKFGNICRHIQIDLNAAAFRKTVQVPRHYGLQPNFIEQWRMQQMRDHANLAHGSLQKSDRLGQRRSLKGREHRIGRLDHFQIHLDRREILALAVVQLAAKPSPLFLSLISRMALVISRPSSVCNGLELISEGTVEPSFHSEADSPTSSLLSVQ